MATSKKNISNVNNSNVTKVICQNCGAEVIIPNHEHTVAGIAIGKDSGLGTVVLPTKNGTGATPMQQLSALTGGNADLLRTVMDLIGKIEDSGYLDVDGIVRRWIPSQCLNMVYSEDGFHKSLQRRGYEYSWKVLLDEMKKQMVLFDSKDIEGYAERNRWYNGKIAYYMAKDYLELLHKFVNELCEHMHKGRPYKNVKCNWMNNGKGVHLDEMGVFFDKLENACSRIKIAKTPNTLYDAVARFNNLRSNIRFCPNGKDICYEFTNAYKAAGAYYTIKDLIMFEDCLMQTDKNDSADPISFYDIRKGNKRKFVEKEESLSALERKAADIVAHGVGSEGYTMLGLLKDFLHYNHFDFDTTQSKWKEQSEMRKAFRKSQRGERRSRK